MIGCVYLVTNLVSGKIYVGKSLKSAADRWRVHCYMARKKTAVTSIALWNAIRKYGESAFTIEELERIPRNELGKAEKRHILRLRANDPAVGYNLTEGGEGCSGYVPTPEVRAKLSLAIKGKILGPRSDAVKRKISIGTSKGQVGHIVSEETRRKISVANLGHSRNRRLTSQEEFDRVLALRIRKSYRCGHPLTQENSYTVEGGLYCRICRSRNRRTNDAR